LDTLPKHRGVGAPPGACRCGIAAAGAPRWVGLARAIGAAAVGSTAWGVRRAPRLLDRFAAVASAVDGTVGGCASVGSPLFHWHCRVGAWSGGGGQWWQEPRLVRAASTLARRLPGTPRRRHALQPAVVCKGCTDASRPTLLTRLCPPLCPHGRARPHNTSCSMRRSRRASSAASAASSSAPAATASFRMALTSRACQS